MCDSVTNLKICLTSRSCRLKGLKEDIYRNETRSTGQSADEHHERQIDVFFNMYLTADRVHPLPKVNLTGRKETR